MLIFINQRRKNYTETYLAARHKICKFERNRPKSQAPDNKTAHMEEYNLFA